MSLAPRYCSRCGGPSGHLICPTREAEELRFDIYDLFAKKQLDISLLTKRAEEAEEALKKVTSFGEDVIERVAIAIYHHDGGMTDDYYLAVNGKPRRLWDILISTTIFLNSS